MLENYLHTSTKVSVYENESDKSESGSSAAFTKIQYSIIRLLGRLGGANRSIVQSSSQALQDTLTWSNAQGKLHVDFHEDDSKKVR